MIKKKTFTNNKNTKLEIAIEPAAEYIDLLPGKTAILEIYYENESSPLEFDITDDTFTIYESKGVGIKIFIDGQLEYYTDYNFNT